MKQHFSKFFCLSEYNRKNPRPLKGREETTEEEKKPTREEVKSYCPDNYEL